MSNTTGTLTPHSVDICPNCATEVEIYRVRPAASLPSDVVDALQQLRRLELESENPAEHRARLNTYLADLRDDHFTLQSLGDALGITRERVRQRANAVRPRKPLVRQPKARPPHITGERSEED